MSFTKNNGNNSLNSAIITKIEKEKYKFYKEIQKLLTKYGFQDDAVADGRLQTLEAENKKLKQELANLRHVQNEQNKIDIISNGLSKEYYLHGYACSGKEFEKHLQAVAYCTVHITLFYKNKPSAQYTWNVSNFTKTSSLNGNLHSGYLRGWRQKQITGIKLEVK